MKNWTVKEAAKVIRENKDTEAIKEIVKHFPLFAVIVAGKDFDGLTDAMPEHMTVRKIENELNSGSTVADEDIEEGEDQEENVEGSEDQDLNAMTKNELIALCEKKGLKVQKHQKPKQYYIDALNGAGDEDTDAAEDAEEEEEDPVALYKKCKKAGLKVAPKKSAKYYKDQLAKAEEAEEDTDDEDDWDDDEEEEEKPVKKTVKKAPAKNGAKKPAKKAEPEEDEDDGEDEDDDEWDI